MPTILTIVGARPQFVKAAPVSRALSRKGLREIIVHTGQHFDPTMSDIFFEELDIPAPSFNLEVNSLNHGAMTGRMIEKLEEIMLQQKPDMILVYGDANTTLAGALAGAKLHIPIAHVEAGLRSFNRRMPEEINRVVVDHLSTLLFCPTETAVRNLAAEGIARGVHAVGDVMHDTVIETIARAKQRSRVLEKLDLQPHSYAVSTVHRAEHTDDPVALAKIVDWLERAARDLPVVMPIHPRTRDAMTSLSMTPKGVQIIDPLGYLDMAQLVHHAAAIYTDSGGLQKEAYYHRVPCVTLRDETEWVETVQAGWNRLWIVPHYTERRDIPEFGDGHSGTAIADVIFSAL